MQGKSRVFVRTQSYVIDLNGNRKRTGAFIPVLASHFKLIPMVFLTELNFCDCSLLPEETACKHFLVQQFICLFRQFLLHLRIHCLFALIILGRHADLGSSVVRIQAHDRCFGVHGVHAASVDVPPVPGLPVYRNCFQVSCHRGRQLLTSRLVDITEVAFREVSCNACCFSCIEVHIGTMRSPNRVRKRSEMTPGWVPMQNDTHIRAADLPHWLIFQQLAPH